MSNAKCTGCDGILRRLQDWYGKHCDGDWEHDFGIVIETTDNPGWWVKINLKGTKLEQRSFPSVIRSRGSNDKERDSWVNCFVDENATFNGAGDVTSLCEILDTFLLWADTKESLDA